MDANHLPLIEENFRESEERPILGVEATIPGGTCLSGENQEVIFRERRGISTKGEESPNEHEDSGGTLIEEGVSTRNEGTKHLMNWGD